MSFLFAKFQSNLQTDALFQQENGCAKVTPFTKYAFFLALSKRARTLKNEASKEGEYQIVHAAKEKTSINKLSPLFDSNSERKVLNVRVSFILLVARKYPRIVKLHFMPFNCMSWAT